MLLLILQKAGHLSGLGQLDLELRLCFLASVVLGETADETKETAAEEPTDFNASNLVLANVFLVLLDQGWVAAVAGVDHGWGVHHGLAMLDTRGAVGSAGRGHGHVGVALGVVDDLLTGVGGTHGLLGHLLGRVAVGGCWGCGGGGGGVLLFGRHDGGRGLGGVVLDEEKGKRKGEERAARGLLSVPFKRFL